jgi:hypothetical protein
MALTIDGIPVSGSIGKTTYARNRAGAYQRRRTKPVNPNSTLQLETRAAFAAAINTWTDDLTPLQRSSWATYAAGVDWLNAAGQAMSLTGQNAFVRWYSWYLFWFAEEPADLNPPVSFDINAVVVGTGVTVTYDTSANTIAIAANLPLFSNLWNVEEGRITARVSQPTNASRNFRPNRFSKASSFVVPEVPAAAVPFVVEASPYVYLDGHVCWVEFRASTPDHALTEATLFGPIAVTVVA